MNVIHQRTIAPWDIPIWLPLIISNASLMADFNICARQTAWILGSNKPAFRKCFCPSCCLQFPQSDRTLFFLPYLSPLEAGIARANSNYPLRTDFQSLLSLLLLVYPFPSFNCLFVDSFPYKPTFCVTAIFQMEGHIFKYVSKYAVRWHIS